MISKGNPNSSIVNIQLQGLRITLCRRVVMSLNCSTSTLSKVNPKVSVGLFFWHFGRALGGGVTFRIHLIHLHQFQSLVVAVFLAVPCSINHSTSCSSKAGPRVHRLGTVLQGFHVTLFRGVVPSSNLSTSSNAKVMPKEGIFGIQVQGIAVAFFPAVLLSINCSTSRRSKVVPSVSKLGVQIQGFFIAFFLGVVRSKSISTSRKSKVVPKKGTFAIQLEGLVVAICRGVMRLIHHSTSFSSQVVPSVDTIGVQLQGFYVALFRGVAPSKYLSTSIKSKVVPTWKPPTKTSMNSKCLEICWMIFPPNFEGSWKKLGNVNHHVQPPWKTNSWCFCVFSQHQETAGMIGVQFPNALMTVSFGLRRFVPEVPTCWVSPWVSLANLESILALETGERTNKQDSGVGRTLRYEWGDSERVTYENDGFLLGSITTLHTQKKHRGPWTPLVLHTLFYIFLQPMITHLESAWPYKILPLFNTSATSDWLPVRSLFCQAMVELCKFLAPSMRKNTITRPTDMPKANLANLARKRRWDGLNRPYQKGTYSLAASQKSW